MSLEKENERLTAEIRSLKEQKDELIRLMNENEARIKAENRELLKKISELESKQKEQREEERRLYERSLIEDAISNFYALFLYKNKG